MALTIQVFQGDCRRPPIRWAIWERIGVGLGRIWEGSWVGFGRGAGSDLGGELGRIWEGIGVGLGSHWLERPRRECSTERSAGGSSSSLRSSTVVGARVTPGRTLFSVGRTE